MAPCSWPGVMNLMGSYGGVIVSARLGGLFEALRQFTPFSHEVRSRHSIALWRLYSKLITTLPPNTLARREENFAIFLKVPSRRQMSTRNLGRGPEHWSICPHFGQNRSRFPILLSVTDPEESRLALLCRLPSRKILRRLCHR